MIPGNNYILVYQIWHGMESLSKKNPPYLEKSSYLLDAEKNLFYNK
jgi:hypothetical protein